MTHIYPINDTKEHDMSSTCDCNPKIEGTFNGEIMCIHNSYDGREGVELANEILNGIDRDSQVAQENETIIFKHNGQQLNAIVISVQHNPIQYFVQDENGGFWHIDESSIIK